MKTAGLIGGVAWPSTLIYYQRINELVQQALGGLHSARCVIASLDFAEVHAQMTAGNPAGAAALMEDAARSLRATGVDLVAILANTGHFAVAEVEAAAGVPLVHIARECGRAVRQAQPGLTRLGLLGTSFALKAPFFAEILSGECGLQLVLPLPEQRGALDALIFEDLAVGGDGRHAPAAAALDSLCASLQARGAEAVLLGCTELSGLLPHMRTATTLFDSTELHARAIVREMLKP
jgi:aspartate racemase